jgi:hypothetical protein
LIPKNTWWRCLAILERFEGVEVANAMLKRLMIRAAIHMICVHQDVQGQIGMMDGLNKEQKQSFEVLSVSL